VKFLESILEKLAPHFEKGGKLEKLYPLFEAADTFMFTPSKTTSGYPHIRDHFDMKRMMISVVVALIPCVIMAAYNTGYQALLAQGLPTDTLSCFALGLKTILPIIIVSYSVGGLWEVLFAIVRKHEINEGFLVTGLLFPLTLPPTIPLWQVALGISFGTVIGKEVFGGTGMNILNPALTARAFVFFTYPGNISGDRVWTAIDYAKDHLVDGYTGATPLLVVAGAEPGTSIMEIVKNSYFTWQDCFLGLIPGSIGETSTLACLIGAILLIAMGIGSWRVMAGMLFGAFGITTLLNFLAVPTSSAFLMLPFHYHLVMGGFAFGMVYMATDPVSAASTQTGKWIYGALIGILAILIRTINPAYPEGVMLAILFMNVFAPLIDHFVVESNIAKRYQHRGQK
jgi:Na+-transporting NADH:ubiquinone oxidoreductase subunit B